MIKKIAIEIQNKTIFNIKFFKRKFFITFIWHINTIPKVKINCVSKIKYTFIINLFLIMFSISFVAIDCSKFILFSLSS